MIASPGNPDLVGTYWKGSLTPKATSSDTGQTSKKLIQGNQYIPNSRWKNGRNLACR